jgi:hypothetical protein
VGSDRTREIEIGADEHRVVDEAIEALTTCPDVYQRAGQLVHVIYDDSPMRSLQPGGLAPRITPLPLPRLRELLTLCASWLRTSKKGEPYAAHPPDWAIKAVAARGQWQGIRYLEAVVESPMLRPDGSVLDRPGYDPTTGLLYVPSIEFGRIADRPTIDDAKTARDELLDVVCDFPFASKEHRAAFLAGMLTPFARHAVHGPVPLFLVDSNVRGAGKGLLCDVISESTIGRSMPRMVNPDSDEEMRKRITALVLGGDKLVLIDNVAGTLGCSSLDAALTGTTWSDRVLGMSTMTKAMPLIATWYATANNVALAADTARRILHVRLESNEEKPEERSTFKHPNLLAWVRVERARLVRAALTILRAFVVAGRPDQKIPPWGSFESWSALVRSALVWIGEDDPAKTRTDLAEHADLEVGALRALINAWSEVDPDGSGVTAAQISTAIATSGERYAGVRAAICDLVPTPNDKFPSTQRIGMKLRSLRRRVVDGRFIDQDPNPKGGAMWFVKRAEKPAEKPGTP